MIIVDESSMVPISMWAALANLKFTGNHIVVLGDMDGQFLPIEDQAQEYKLEGLNEGPFMYDLCNGLYCTLSSYRRGKDRAHFDFVGSIYPKLGMSLEQALAAARERYPSRQAAETTLCITHRRRIAVNGWLNSALAKELVSVLVPKPEAKNKDTNQQQDMYIWPGIVLMARTKGIDAKIRNGLRYKVLTMSGGAFELVQVDDENEVKGESFPMSEADLAAKMRLTHALTYFSSQARTITGSLRLVDTDHVRFTIRHLIVGLGRAPNGCDVHAE